MTAKEFIEQSINQVDNAQTPQDVYYAKGVLDLALELGHISRDEWASLHVDIGMDDEIED